MKRFSVIGAGNLGINLINSLIKKRYQLQYIYKKTRYDAFTSHLNNNVDLLVKESDFIFISTQESKISAAADLIAAEADPVNKIFFHTSNSLTSERLQRIKERGGITASFSPLQTFVDYAPGTDLFSGIYFLAEGDRQALTLAEEIANNLNANILFVEKEEKKYLHLAAVAAANFLISILKFAENQLHKANREKPAQPQDTHLAGKFKKRKEYNLGIMLPLIKQTLNNVAAKGVGASLSGPLQRKEYDIIEKHLALLEQDEADFYNILTAYLKK